MNRTTALGAALALLLSAPALAACEDSGNKDEKAVKETVEKAMHALGNKDGKAFCETMTTKDGKKPVKDEPKELEECVKGMEILSSGAPEKLEEYKNAKVSKASVNGDTASVKESDIEGMPQRTKAPGEKPSEDLKLKKIDGNWYLDNTTDTPTAPSAPAAGDPTMPSLPTS